MIRKKIKEYKKQLEDSVEIKNKILKKENINAKKK